MRVLTLKQPWAKLVVMGAKRIETRGFNTNVTGNVLIHSSKGKHALEGWLLKQPEFDVLKGRVLEYGKIIGCVEIGGTFRTDVADEYFKSDRYLCGGRTKSERDRIWQTDSTREKAFGDYTPGRFGWELYNPVEFTNLTTFTGGVGFTKFFKEKICLVCGCTQDNCIACIEKTGQACHWINKHLCSACKQ